MTTVRELHNKAMLLAQEAIIAKEQGDRENSEILARQACQLEEQAANMVPFSENSEPTRSILYKSAASLAYQSKDFDKANRLIIQGLSGFPPYQIEEELNNLFDQVRFERNLRTREAFIDSDAIEITIKGDSVGSGIIPYSELKKRIDGMVSIFDKTTLRLLQGQFGTRLKQKLFEPLIEAPKAGSFIVGMKLEVLPNKQLPLLFNAEIVINEIMLGIERVNNNDEVSLREQMGSDEYYRHFVSMTQEMAPDGKKINLVAFTSRNKTVNLTRNRDDIPIVTIAETDKEQEKETAIVVEGVLDYANSQNKKSEMGLTTDNNEQYTITVDAGLEDYVRGYYKRYVRIYGTGINKQIHFIRLEELD